MCCGLDHDRGRRRRQMYLLLSNSSASVASAMSSGCAREAQLQARSHAWRTNGASTEKDASGGMYRRTFRFSARVTSCNNRRLVTAKHTHKPDEDDTNALINSFHEREPKVPETASFFAH